MAANDPKILTAARALLKKGDVDGAVRAFASTEAYDEAARALASEKRFVEAADVLLSSLGVPADQLAVLRDPHLRARANHAADLLREAGITDAADEIDEQMERTSQNFGAAALDEERTGQARPGPPAISMPPDEGAKTEI